MSLKKFVNNDELVNESSKEKNPINNNQKEKPTQTKEKTIIEEPTPTSIVENSHQVKSIGGYLNRNNDFNNENHYKLRESRKRS